jgi:hypothetical protein
MKEEGREEEGKRVLKPGLATCPFEVLARTVRMMSCV